MIRALQPARKPCSADTSYPYPVELDVPQWTAEWDVDFRRWLGGYGEGLMIKIEKRSVAERIPTKLRHLIWLPNTSQPAGATR